MQLVLRGMGKELLVEYLVRLGGRVTTSPGTQPIRLQGTDWTAQVHQRKVQLGSLALREVTIDFGGPDEVVQKLVSEFRKLSLRAGG